MPYRLSIQVRPLVFPLVAGLALLAAGNSKGYAADAAADEGFEYLTGADAQERWTAYGVEGIDGAWPKTWSIEGDVLRTTGGGGDLMTTKDYSDFDLRFDWKVPAGANSGVMYRVGPSKDPSYFTGPEYQILDNAGHADGKNALTSTASLYGLYAPSKEAAKPAGQWNSSRIVVRGKHVDHYLNGELVVSADIDSDDWKTRLAASKFAAWKAFATLPTGRVVLQDHGDEVSYRGVRIKPLAPAAAK